MKTLLASLLVASSALAQVVPWTAETSSIPSTQAGDPTFVATPAGVQLVVGTDTAQTGIFAWTPDGVLAQVLPFGIVTAADSRGALVAVSSANNGLLFFHASDAGLTQLQPALNVATPGQVALARHADGGYELWFDTSSQTVEHYAVSPAPDGGVSFVALASITVPEVPSGLAVDDRSGQLYVGQPTLGVMAVQRNGTSSFLLSIDAGQLGTLVGGLDLFLSADGGALLFSTSPNSDEVMVHALAGAQATFRTALEIGVPDGGSARVRGPKFVDVFEQPVAGFPRGVLVLHDGVMGNYKIVSLASVHAVFPLPDPFLPPAPAGDAGLPSDAGVADAGVDGGVDGGVVDGGTGGGGGSGRPPGPAPGVEPPPSCGCTGGPFTVLPALLLLWWIRRLRS